MKTVVLVTDIAFWLNTLGSHMRIQGLVRHLLLKYNVKIFFLKSVPPETSEYLKSIGLYRLEIISYKRFSGRKTNFTPTVSKHYFFKNKSPDDFVSSFKSFLEENSVDIVIFEYIRLSYMLDGCPSGLPVILDMHDVMSSRTISLKRAGIKSSIEMGAATEREMLLKYDKILAISRDELQFLEKNFRINNAIYVPSSVEKSRKRTHVGKGNQLIFIGGASSPNISGLKWFIDQVFPLLYPLGFVLNVIGTVCDAFPRENVGIIWHGQKDKLDEYLDAADISINPVFVGGGLKIKCIDALASGLPCVTTAEGAAGLEQAIGRGLFVAHDRLSFFAAIRYLAMTPGRRRIAGMTGPAIIESEFTDATAYRLLSGYMEERLAEKAR